MLQWNDVPPDAVNVDEPPTQIDGLAGIMLHDGSGFTVTVVEHELLHPLPFETVTVKTVVTLGVTVMTVVVAPVLQMKVVPPAEVSVAEPPGQMVCGGQMVQVGPGVTVTDVEQELVQPFAFVTVTV